MKTFVSKKTGARYPVWSMCSSLFQMEEGQKHEVFIRPGYPDFTRGWKRMDMKRWTEETIPDLEKPFTDAQLKSYAFKYGNIVAQEFLECADICKESHMNYILNPPANAKLWEDSEGWFKAVFGENLFVFACPILMTMANVYSLDVIKFDKFLQRRHGYQDNGISTKDFLTQKFGEDVALKIRSLIPEVK